MERRRVVVTGMGAICPIGNSVDEIWNNAKAGQTGISKITQFDTAEMDTHIAGEVKGFDEVEFLGKRDARRTDRVTQFALYTSHHALEDSKLEVNDENRYEIGCVIGSGIGGINTLVETVINFETRGQKAVSPIAVPRILIDSSSGRVSMAKGLRGPNFCIATACATGNNCIGEAAEIIRRGQATMMLAGASESAIVGVVIAGFANMTALSQRNDEPARASRPFDVERDGFVSAEGAGILMLEELEHAKARGAKIYAEVLGYGHTSDAYHITAPLETGDSAAEAMRMAMEDANIQPEAIDYINAHGTSTQLNDVSETMAIKKALGEHAYTIPISSTKSMTGHMLGAAGAVEAIFCVKAIEEGFVPPTINLENQDPECDLNYTPNTGVKHNIQIAMSNSFGFGGHNAVIILGKYSENGHG